MSEVIEKLQKDAKDNIEICISTMNKTVGKKMHTQNKLAKYANMSATVKNVENEIKKMWEYQ